MRFDTVGMIVEPSRIWIPRWLRREWDCRDNQLKYADMRTHELVGIQSSPYGELFSKKLMVISPYTGTAIPLSALCARIPESLEDSKLWC